MKNRLIIILLGALIILSSLTIAYQEEIQQVSKDVQEYVIQKIQTLSTDQQKDFEEFKELPIEDKISRSLELNMEVNK